MERTLIPLCDWWDSKCPNQPRVTSSPTQLMVTYDHSIRDLNFALMPIGKGPFRSKSVSFNNSNLRRDACVQLRLSLRGAIGSPENEIRGYRKPPTIHASPWSSRGQCPPWPINAKYNFRRSPRPKHKQKSCWWIGKPHPFRGSWCAKQ